MDGCTDGSWTDPDGFTHQFFKCPHGRGFYYPLRSLQPDSRFQPHIGKVSITYINITCICISGFLFVCHEL